MTLQEKVRNYWHVPTATIAFQRLLLENRGMKLSNNLDVWKEAILSLEDLSEEEQALLTDLIQRIDSEQTEFTLDVLYLLIKDVSIRYLDDRYVLMKYTQFVTYENSWNAFYRYARGVVMDMEKVEVATATLEKFFNIDERVETSLGTVMHKMKNGRTVKYIKQDGSNVNVSYQDRLLITTPGSFDSQQVEWATALLKTKHPAFIDDLKGELQHLTFVFEYVGPENRIVVIYPNTDMILLHIVDKRTGALLSYETIIQYANRYGFTPCETVDLSLEQIMKEKDLPEVYRSDEQEGWVIRVDGEEESFLVKLKCSDYVNMHRMIANALSPKWVYEAIITETFDDKFALLENETIKAIVGKIAATFFAWGKEKKEKFEAIYEAIEESQWIEEEFLQNNRSFEKQVQELVAGIENEDKVRKFLVQFSKGKVTDPKEEIRMKAKQLYDLKVLDLTELENFDQYKMMISFRVKEFVKELRQVIDAYVFEGDIHPAYQSFLAEHFADYYAIEADVKDLEEWKKRFEENKDEYYRLASIKKENLTPAYFNIHLYAKKKLEAEKKREEMVSFSRKKANEFFFRESSDDFVATHLDANLIINDEAYAFYLEKKRFEEVVVKEHFEDGEKDTINKIVGEYYLLARDLESDNSYAVAKEIFAKIEDQNKNQQAFYARRGKFSGFVNQHIESAYRPFVFELAAKTSTERHDYVREIDFLPLAQIVLVREEDKLDVFDIDFRNIQEITKNIDIENE